MGTRAPRDYGMYTDTHVHFCAIVPERNSIKKKKKKKKFLRYTMKLIVINCNYYRKILFLKFVVTLGENLTIRKWYLILWLDIFNLDSYRAR